jgi:hypothetical protein
MPGALYHFLAADHTRLDRLLQRAVTNTGSIDHAPYAEFRAGLLKHISMEEKILLPAAQRLRGGEPLPSAATLRRHHSALAALLVPTPTLSIIAALRTILATHNELEERHEGVYACCEELAGPEAAVLLAQLKAAPEVPVAPHADGPDVMATVRRTLARAGFEAALIDKWPEGRSSWDKAAGHREREQRCDGDR